MTDAAVTRTPPRKPPLDPADVRWFRADDGLDHAFGVKRFTWIRSRCGAVRWTVALTPSIPGPSNPCPVCDPSKEVPA